MKYLRERREALGGSGAVAADRRGRSRSFRRTPTSPSSFNGSGDREVSTTMAFVKHFGRLLKDKKIGKYIVPIVPDESRTFGMEALFRQMRHLRPRRPALRAGR